MQLNHASGTTYPGGDSIWSDIESKVAQVKPEQRQERPNKDYRQRRPTCLIFI